MEDRREDLQRCGAWAGLALRNPQQRRLIAPERRHQRRARRIELAQIVRGGLDRRTRAVELVAQAIEQADAPLQRSPDQRPTEVVDDKLASLLPPLPRSLEPLRAGLVAPAFYEPVAPAADDTTIEGHACRYCPRSISHSQPPS